MKRPTKDAQGRRRRSGGHSSRQAPLCVGLVVLSAMVLGGSGTVTPPGASGAGAPEPAKTAPTGNTSSVDLQKMLSSQKAGLEKLAKANRLAETWRVLKDEGCRKEAEALFQAAVEGHTALLQSVQVRFKALEPSEGGTMTARAIQEMSAVRELEWNLSFELAQMHILRGRLHPDDNPDPDRGNEEVEKGNDLLNTVRSEITKQIDLHQGAQSGDSSDRPKKSPKERADSIIPPSFYYLKAIVMRGRGRFGDAIRLFDGSIQGMKDRPDFRSTLHRAYLEKADCLLEQSVGGKKLLGDAVRAMEELVRVAAEPGLEPIRKRANLVKAQALLLQGKPRDALALVLPSVRDPGSAIRECLARGIVKDAALLLPASEQPGPALRDIGNAKPRPQASGEDDGIPPLQMGRISVGSLSFEPSRDPYAFMGSSVRAVHANELGLEWLAGHQEPDGHWDCGKHGGEKKEANDATVTGLATLAFLAAGYTDLKGGVKYVDNVKRALDWLQKRQAADGSFSKNNRAHAICALVATEAYWMTDARKGMAQRAVDFICRQQKPSGGWDYGDQGEPERERSDTSITCWHVLALKSASHAKLKAPQAALDGALKRLRANGGMEVPAPTGKADDGIVGKKPSEGSLAMMSMTMLSGQLLGVRQDDPFLIAGAGLLEKQGAQIADVPNLYYVYFGSMALFRMGKKHFETWNVGMRDPLIAIQVKEAGDHQGSWPSEKDKFGKEGGRVYTTAMACLCLGIYSRYLLVYAAP